MERNVKGLQIVRAATVVFLWMWRPSSMPPEPPPPPPSPILKKVVYTNHRLKFFIKKKKENHVGTVTIYPLRIISWPLGWRSER